MITAPSSPARSYIGSLRERLARREDSEHVQALIRVGFGLFISIYLYSTIGPRLDIHVVCIGFEILSLAIVACDPDPPATLRVAPRIRRCRRSGHDDLPHVDQR